MFVFHRLTKLKCDPTGQGGAGDSFRCAAAFLFVSKMVLEGVAQPGDHRASAQRAKIWFTALRQIDWQRVASRVHRPPISYWVGLNRVHMNFSLSNVGNPL